MRMWYMSRLEESEIESYANIQVMRIPGRKKAGAKILRPRYISGSLKNSKVARVARVE